MPSLARKVVICAAVDGLILQPLNTKKDQQQRPSPAFRVKFGDGSISTVSRESVPDLSKPNSSFEAFGIVGLVTVFRYSYLVSITRRQQVAQIRGLPIYVITEVALTPCSSHEEASEAIAKTAIALNARANTDKSSDDDSTSVTEDEGISPGESTKGADDDSGTPDPANDDAQWLSSTAPTEEGAPGAAGETAGRSSSSTPRSSVAQDVISRRGSYGRFAQRWFSRSGWTMDQKRNMGLSPDQAIAADTGPGESPEAAAKSVPKKFSVPNDAAGNEAAVSLLPKLLRSTQILFGSSRTFYYSYDYDITRSMANPRVPESDLVPLHQHVDPTFFWNRNIMKPFIDAGADALALPLMQGFVGQRTFTVDSHPPQDDDGSKDSVELKDFAAKGAGSNPASPPPEKSTAEMRASEKNFDITVISRRSTKRAGLRYLRRGIDEDGYVANSVETEQILSPAEATWSPEAKVYSFVQIRGSFPLFFTQSPYSLKPAPVMQHSPDANYAALKKHFDRLRQQYGSLQIVNLVEKHGVEAPIGRQYEENIQRLNEEAGSEENKVAFEWFDFHDVCRGMKFENVSLLLQTLGPKLEALGNTVTVNDRPVAKQTGVLRTNCMDCLDRTNVCQSSFAKHMLDLQLKDQGFDMAAQADRENAWFNTLWADNGDAISKQYAGSGAMKGDYTRTRKRNYRGALMDAGLSLTRLFNGMFNDFFLQTTIDFLLGNVTSLVFEEFEANMMTKDPAVSMQKMREQAIELCQKRVVADESEEFIGGWTLLTPHVADTVKAQSLEEAVLLLTDVALYLCRFDWNLDKVSSFERVDLAHVQKIKFGTYITSTISSAQMDEMRNVGLVVEYKPGTTDETRVNTRSISSSHNQLESSRGPEIEDDKAAEQTEKTDAKITSGGGGGGGFVGLFPRRPVATPPRKIALKALHSQTSAADPTVKDAEPGAVTRLSELQQIVVIASEIERLALQNQPKLAGGKKQDSGLIEKGDIISPAEARKNTGLLEQLGHSIKKMVWA
ncbi:SacI homology domain-containing protein [Diplogelasinospora grovesii]|uniref:SacI homology domain-containing protein n=1 Tax=Diplogelasinospora grovesii TaxID=303347 RepID=A0AAN6SAN9_9PEZI|nr:SacI homology domain-containing protein [Diplogelasinospora grovesii]